ncbi:Os01g0890001 [Oryza sativa Japonica Group]|uniref:Uncharacterized protein n=3 Tax=Oryza sativa TaxID=4530 RepID=A0A8J8YJT4_ORYSJ|nr:hypothetical protein OsI_04739 [Oryza sativa Indica Group]EEE55785.1 hypothetical protein OsJ_04359 [Oryza sativa Japonica Group]KAB8084681.1 hypothetical protein EE612_007294 [Oryza sativa]BAS75648.1 Os01g0890001 [Oryza sativa Japonica Group]
MRGGEERRKQHSAGCNTSSARGRGNLNCEAGRTPERTCRPERSTSGHQRAAGLQ